MDANKTDQNIVHSSDTAEVIPNPANSTSQIQSAGSFDPTDGRVPYQWETLYPRKAVREIRLESVFLFLLLFLSLFLIFANWQGLLFSHLQVPNGALFSLKKYTYYATAGMLGGVVFGIKFFYRAVARGYWHQDRRIWRIMSPFLAMTLAFAIGALIDANLFATRGPSSGPAFVSIGFLTGYFADQANAKMCEIANVIFGSTASKKPKKKKNKGKNGGE